jgi:hypothetical protein
MSYRRLTILLTIFAVVATPAFAGHAWGNYHWSRASNPVQLTVGDNFSTSAWDTAYDDAIQDWNQSTVLSLTKVAGNTTPRKCTAATGTIEVCADTYGNNGWLGIAGISVSGDHITKAYAKMNDSYYTPGGSYDTAAWRALVMCQEIGHDFGLGHQDEDFNNNNLNTCMDYTSDPGSNQHPNSHDYNMLKDIYAHLDDGGGGGGGCKGKNCLTDLTSDFDLDDAMLDEQALWGELVSRSEDGHQETHVLSLGGDRYRITHVTYAMGYEDLSDEEALITD